MKTRKTRGSVRLVHGRHVISELPVRPGPTHSVFDVLAAALAALSGGDEVTLLGFAAGGMIAPLRALGRDDRVHGIDLDLTGARLFQRHARAWAGDVSVTRTDAVDFMRRQRRRQPCIVEDLSMQLEDGDVQKPDVSFDVLPKLIARKLSARGLAVFNLLPSPSRNWIAIERSVGAPFPEVRVVLLDEFENRVLLAARNLPEPASLQVQLDAVLELIGSRMTGTLQVRDRRT
ncbi:MAG: hypothetical protein JST54_01755 [Deltaproteobacteria bacterium]|nr:hypothetical protein [Deltaproteobacteria bacterium]